MRFGLIVISASLLLTGCSTVRDIFGATEEAIEANQTPREIGAPDGDSDPAGGDAGDRAAPVTLWEDIKQAAKRLPDNLAGDSANRAHLGDPITPQ